MAELERKSHLAVAPAPVTMDGTVTFSLDAPATFTPDGPVLDPAAAPLAKEAARCDALSPTLRIEDFLLRSCLGIGAFATVHRAIRNSDGLQVLSRGWPRITCRAEWRQREAVVHKRVVPFLLAFSSPLRRAALSL